MIDIQALARNNGLQTLPSGDKHCRPGWLQFQCPFCRSGKWHLGFNIPNSYFNCWSCGRKKLDETFQRLLGCTQREVWAELRKYSTGEKIIPKNAPKQPQVRRKALRTPIGLGPLLPKHRGYIKRRGFNPDKLEDIWGIGGVGQADPEYRWRIYIPITYEDKLVTYQCRGISDNQKPPYLACGKDREVRPIKECLYGLDQVKGDTVVVVEGVTDVWRLGPGAVCTFGTSWIQAQVNILKQFSTVYIAYDPEDEAQAHADELGLALYGLGPEVEVIDFEQDCDPGDMTNAAARSIMKELGLR